MARKKKEKKPEMTTMQFIRLYLKEIAGALALIAFGCLLYRYSEDIAACFGDMVQKAFNELLRMMGVE